MEKKKEFIINVLYIAIICALVYFGLNYLLGLIFPFVLGSVFAYAGVKTCKKIFKDDSKVHRTLALILIYLIIVLILVILVASGISKISDFIRTLPAFYKNTLEPYITNLENSFESLGDYLPYNLRDILHDMTDGIFDAVKSLLSSATSLMVNLTTSLITNVPSTLVSVIVTMVTSFYVASDYEEMAEWLSQNIPEKVMSVLNEIKDFVENTLLKILTSYAMIMGITFIELCFGLTLIRISNSAIWAFFIALLDILPVLGVGTVLLPWGFSSLITGRTALGIELLVLYLIIAVIRNIIEPKFVGTSLNLHPLATLVSMIIGVRLFGGIGMFAAPLTLSFLYTRKNHAESRN